MRRAVFALAVACGVLGSGGCRGGGRDTITQMSTIDAILAGAYEGQMSCGELLEHGDLGIGTFEGLDGEMVVLDGRVFQVRADGKVYRPGSKEKTPFAAVVEFAPDFSLPVKEKTDLPGLERIVDAAVPNPNVFVAIRAMGRFASMKTRSVPAQKPPYPPLAEVTKNQPVFEMENVSGTLVGFRTPSYAQGICVPGYHVHFLSDDRQSGGHVLEFAMESGTAEADVCHRFLMILPEGDGAFGRIDLSRDRSAELERAER